MQQDTTLRIRTIDGEEHLFAMATATEAGAGYTVGTRIEKLLNQRNIALDVDGRLLIIPMEQIRSIEVSPLASKLPEALVPKVLTISSSLCSTVASAKPVARKQRTTSIAS